MTVTIEVAYSPAADTVELVELSLPPGSTVEAALRASGVLGRHPTIDLAQAAVGIGGRAASLDATLTDGDRVELYRPLAVDPKEARRLRYRDQKTRGPSASGSRSR